MRAFILVALLAMAATVSCQDINVSPACNASSNALDVPSVNDAEKAIVKGGCTKVEFSTTSNQCIFDNTTSIYNCKCEQTLTNTAAWEVAVRNISNGQPCYLSLTFTLTGTVKVDNTTTKPITFNSTQTNYDQVAVGGNCTGTEIGAVFSAALTGGTSVLSDTKDPLNADSQTTGVTWTTGTVSVTGCGIQRTSSVVNIPQPSTGSTGGSSTGGTPGSSTGGSTNNPTGGSTGSSTAGGKNNGASVYAQSAAAVASLIAAVAILA